MTKRQKRSNAAIKGWGKKRRAKRKELTPIQKMRAEIRLLKADLKKNEKKAKKKAADDAKKFAKKLAAKEKKLKAKGKDLTQKEKTIQDRIDRDRMVKKFMNKLRRQNAADKSKRIEQVKKIQFSNPLEEYRYIEWGMMLDDWLEYMEDLGYEEYEALEMWYH